MRKFRSNKIFIFGYSLVNRRTGIELDLETAIRNHKEMA